MKFDIEINSKQIKVELINKKSLKHCYLRLLSPTLVQIKAHSSFSYNDALLLLEKKRKWLLKHINNSNLTALKNNEFYFLGQVEEVFEEQFNKIDYYKTCAKEIMPPIIEKFSEQMQLFPTKIGFRNNKSRWGSCSYKNVINLNINLMKFPLSVIEYVIIHELAHIKHKNHSKDFWNLVEVYCPSYKEQERLLKGFL